MSGFPASYEQLSIASVDVGVRLRRTDPAWVEALALLMREQGLLQPIAVVLEEGGRYSLVAGAHRLAAAKALAWDTIDARVTPAAWIKDQERRLQEILENVARNELNKLDRAANLAELKALYEQLHPSSRNGGDRRSQAAKDKRENQNEIFAFCSETAKRIGLSRRSIELAVAIWSGLSVESRSRLSGTWLADHQASLQTLSGLDAATQKKVLDLLLSDPAGAETIADAVMIAEGRRPPKADELALKRALTGFTRLDRKGQRAFLRQNKATVIAILREEGWI